MYSLEKMAEITGDIDSPTIWNGLHSMHCLPKFLTDFMTKQYFQQANQVMVTRHRRNFDQTMEERTTVSDY